MPWAGKAARVRETTIASLAVVMKIGNVIVIHIDVETEIGTEAVNTEKEIVTEIVLHVKSVIVIVTEIGVIEKEDTVTVTKETEKDVRNVHREKIKTEKSQKNNEKKKDIVKRQGLKLPVARKRENWCRARRRVEEPGRRKKLRAKILSREKKVSGHQHHDHAQIVWCVV